MPELPVLPVVEGVNDIGFLKAISTLLCRANERLANLVQMEAEHQVIFLPTGGSNLKDWMPRIASLGKREFHLYDREQEPETSERRQVVASVNQRPGCVAVLTRKRAVENYLHPLAISAACGIELQFDDNSDVANLLGRAMLAKNGGLAWQELPYKGQRRLREKAKKLLNGKAVAEMTIEMLQQQDWEDEVVGWLQGIQLLVAGSACFGVPANRHRTASADPADADPAADKDESSSQSFQSYRFEDLGSSPVEGTST
jgi:hypothetical protein